MVGFDRLGQLKEGYKADFLILDRDILEIPPEEIDQVSVAETYINGRCVYRKKQIKYEGEKRMFTLPKYYEPDFFVGVAEKRAGCQMGGSGSKRSRSGELPQYIYVSGVF